MSKHEFDEHQMNIEFEAWATANDKYLDATGIVAPSHYEAVVLAFKSGWQASHDWHVHGLASDD